MSTSRLLDHVLTLQKQVAELPSRLGGLTWRSLEQGHGAHDSAGGGALERHIPCAKNDRWGELIWRYRSVDDDRWSAGAAIEPRSSAHHQALNVVFLCDRWQHVEEGAGQMVADPLGKPFPVVPCHSEVVVRIVAGARRVDAKHEHRS
jgi:hypothetical protein